MSAPAVFSTDERIGSLLDQSITRHMMSTLTDQGGKICAEYVWIGGNGGDVRSKGRTLDKMPEKPEDLPMPPDQPTPRSTWLPAPSTRTLSVAEYTLLNALTKWPLGWPKGGYPAPQGPYYCAAGAGLSIARDICEVHYRCCLYAGIAISGVNSEVLPSQWEYQVGPVIGIAGGDQLWMSRYILHRICEMYNVECTFDPKPIPGDWNGAGGHVNYSTNGTRKEGTGWEVIQEHCAKLGKRHAVHIAAAREYAARP
eukprot:gene7812-1009_t